MKKTIHSPQSKLISEKLVEIRKKAKLTQRELAKILEREHSFVAHYELGERRIDLAEFYWICAACGASAHKEASNLMKAFANLDPTKG
jgi:transcriptional regulator with XRE-family HTH domain